MRHRDHFEFETEFRGFRFQHRMRLLAVSGIVIQQRDFLAFEFARAAVLVGDELDDSGGAVPVIGHQRKHPREHTAIGGVSAAVAQGDQGNSVDRRLVDEAVGNAGRHGMESGRAGGAARFQTLIALHALGVVVLGFAFLPGELDAVDAAVALIDQIEVVDHAGEYRGAVGAIGTDAVAQNAHELSAGLLRRDWRRHTQAANEREQRDQHCFSCAHILLQLPVCISSGGTATAVVSLW